MAYVNQDGVQYWTSVVRELADQTYSPIIVNKASGAIASFPDGADDVPLKSLVFGIEPKQDLHGYANPWPGGGGINKMPHSASSTTSHKSITFVSDGNGKYTLSGTADGNANATLNLEASYTIQSGDYLHIFNSVAVGTLALGFDDNTSGYPSMNPANRIFALTNYVGKTLVKIGFSIPSGSAFNGTIQPMICNVSSVTPWTPYSNICPITGWSSVGGVKAGGNILLVDAAHIAKPNIYPSTWGGISLYGENGMSQSRRAADGGYGGVWWRVKAGTYTISFDSDASNAADGLCYVLQQWNDDGTKVDIRNVETTASHISYTFSITQESTLTLRIAASGSWVTATHYIYVTHIQLELGSTAAAYTAPTITPITIALGQTVYGGTLDALAGSGLKTMDKVTFNGTETWLAATNGRFYTVLSSIKQVSASSVKANMICSRYATKTANEIFLGQDGISLQGTSTQIIIRDSTFTGTTAAEFAQYVAANPFDLVYELATPIELDITPVTGLVTFEGENNIWCDSGDTEVGYVADTKLFIERLTAPTEDDFVANSNIASGKYFMIGNDLYLSTSAIASGEQIVVGTNCTKTSLAAALNAINA